MKNIYSILMLSCMIGSGVQSASAQTIPTSPMAGLQDKTVSSSKFFAAYEQFDHSNNYGSLHTIFGRSTGAVIDSLHSSTYTGAGVDAQLPLSSHLSAAAGDFNGDGFDDQVTVAINHNMAAYIEMNFSDPAGTLGITSRVTLAYPWTLSTMNEGGQSRINVAAGDLDGDHTDEMVLQWVDSSGHNLYLQVNKYNGTSVPMTSYAYVPDGAGSYISLPYGINAAHIATGDLDGDGNDEIIVGYLKSNTANPNYRNDFYIAIYDFVAGALVYKGRTLVTSSTQANNCSVTAGRFTGTHKMDIAWALGQSSQFGNNSWVGLATVDITQASPLTLVGTPIAYSNSSGITNIATGDLNGDYIDEIVLAAGGVVRVIKVTNTATSFQQSASYTFYNYTVNFPNSSIAVADVNKDMKAEIFLMGSTQIYGSGQEEVVGWQVFRADAALTTITSVAYKPLLDWDNSMGFGSFTFYPLRRYAIAAGNYDGQEFTVGQGTMYMKADVVQPLIILNAPPVHFDILDSASYDIAQCYNGGGCSFSSTYYTNQSTQVDVSTEVTSDWAVSGTLSAGGSFGIVDVGGYMTASYGEQYSHVAAATNVINIQTQVSATADDYIYAAISDYYVWEYPVSRRGVPKGYIANVTPSLTDSRWFTSKTWAAFNYIPNHEVGCILSYKDYPDFADNPDVEQKIKGSYTGNSVTLDANNGFSWTLSLSDVTASSASTQKDIGIEVGANAGVGGVSLETSASYNSSDVKTYSTTLQTDLSLTADISSPLDMTIGEVRYTVTPYTYWAKNGALVLDYAAKPEQPIGGGTATWWTDNYSVQDPAFIMPWRYDPDKGLALQDERKRRQSKSITIYPLEAATGDTVKVTTAVFNFSLVPTQDSIKVQFFVGDPLMGTRITDTHGNTDFWIPSIAARDRYTLQMDWQVPAGIYQFPRIYAVIDPDNTLNEIHRNNDVGFNIFSVTDGALTDPDTIATATAITEVPAAMHLMHTYPNPFGNSILFEYDVKNEGTVELSIYDVDGRLVATPVSGTQSYGMHSKVYNATLLSPGVYTYRFTSGGHTETDKLVKF
ncbi:MAG: 5-Nucleotidase domain protein [Bacteroidetes bacterium]|nr:5-Nucleotidase domain protein [Bacteroidota bacterium]